MKRYDVIVIGAGPAGLSAGIQAARCGASVLVLDENARPGGQLFKQIHKFFGSKEHQAKVRGYRIGENLLAEAARQNVEVLLNSTVIGLYRDKEVLVRHVDEIEHFKGDTVIIATGASENAVTFPGWTLPGVMGAGAAQTLMNLHRVQPGRRILMLGSGNVGLVVGFQLLQAGCELVGIVDLLPHVGGYGVHASKLARCGVPFYLSHTILKAEGTEHVTGVTIGEMGPDRQIIAGSEKTFEVDTICLAVGLSPMSQLARMAGCDMDEVSGGPVCDECGATGIPGIYAAGDVSGIEEASSAMIEGRIAGISAAGYLGYLENAQKEQMLSDQFDALCGLRKGMFAPGNKGKTITETDEGIALSDSLLCHGYVGDDEISRFPGVTKTVGVHPVIECTQNIPCNPCQDACRFGCISVGTDITALPKVAPASKCTGCGMCVASCSGQAIFLVDEDCGDGFAEVTLPYEFYPLPEKGESGKGLSRSGEVICDAQVVRVRQSAAFDQTALLTIRVPAGMAMRARFYRSVSA